MFTKYQGLVAASVALGASVVAGAAVLVYRPATDWPILIICLPLAAVAALCIETECWTLARREEVRLDMAVARIRAQLTIKKSS